MNFEEIAIELINEVCGLQSPEHVKGVVKVLRAVMKGVNEQWEEHLALETTDVLMYDNIICSCGRLIEIERSRKEYSAYVEEHQ